VTRYAICTLLILCALFAARATLAEPLRLEDGTTVDRWTLSNGLEVVARDVPGTRVISISWGYRIGLDHDPADRPGLATLLAEVAFTAPAGDTPERTREEMESLRPQGWNLRVSRRQSLFNETATTSQFPGVLLQIAGRMRGVMVTDADLHGALVTVHRTLEERYSGTADQTLYWHVREYARGLDQAAIAALAAAKGLDRETPASVQQAIARAYVPANGVLVLAGDLSGLDLRSIIASEFGALPAGDRLAAPPAPRFDSVTVVLQQPGLDAPVAVIGLMAPALSDTLHPSFHMALLVLGGQAKQSWDPPAHPLTTRFQYSLLEDPGFARLYPPAVPPQAPDPQNTSAILRWTVDGLQTGIIERETYDGLRHNLLWMMGGPMPKELLDGVRRDPAALNFLCASLASQALWGNEVFWAEYRRRFDASVSPEFGFWADWLRDPGHQTTLLLLPRR
jgi:predicted Zn-dependent peptidase